MTLSSYPGAVDSFTTHVDNVNEDIAADHVNKLQDAVVAIETDILVTKNNAYVGGLIYAYNNFGGAL